MTQNISCKHGELYNRFRPLYDRYPGGYTEINSRISRMRGIFKGWIKTRRIERLRTRKAIEISREEYVGKYELNTPSAKAYIKKLRKNSYNVKDTGESIKLSKDSAGKIAAYHKTGNEVHLISISVIPQMIENSIFIDELLNEKNNGKYELYRYYMCGLKIGNEDYTVKIVVGVKESKYEYYDHCLSKIEKNKLIDKVSVLPSSDKASFSEVDIDNRLITILQGATQNDWFKRLCA